MNPQHQRQRRAGLGRAEMRVQVQGHPNQRLPAALVVSVATVPPEQRGHPELVGPQAQPAQGWPLSNRLV